MDVFFFFQAEDGIRDIGVTGVQTCALPILFVKEVKVEGRRYIVCRNEAEAEKDRAERQAIIAGLERQLRRGDKALIGNSAYRRCLRRVAASGAEGNKGKPGPAFEIDAGKLAEEARYRSE